MKHILFFSIVLGAEYLSYVKSIETHARAFLPLNISAVGSVQSNSKSFKPLQRVRSHPDYELIADFERTQNCLSKLH